MAQIMVWCGQHEAARERRDTTSQRTLHTVLYYTWPVNTPAHPQRIPFNQPTWNGRMARSTDATFQTTVNRYKRSGDVVILADLVEDADGRRYINERHV